MEEWGGGGGFVCDLSNLVMFKTINAFLSIECYVVFVNVLFNFQYMIICWFKVIRIVLDVE